MENPLKEKNKHETSVKIHEKKRKIHDFPSNFQGVKGCHLPSKPSRDQGTLHLRPRCRWGPGSRGRRRSHCPRNDLRTAGIANLEDLSEKLWGPGAYGDFNGILAMAVGFFDEKNAEKSPNDFCGCLWSTVKKNGILVHFYRQLWLPDDHLKWFSCQNNLTSKCFKYFIEFCCREILIFVQTSLLDRSLQQILVAKTRAQYTNHIQIWLTIHGHVVEAAWELMQSWIAKGDVGIAWHCHLCWQGHRTLLRCIGTRHA